MAASGMAIMLKTLGLDPDELKSNVDGFMSHMKDQAATINANQQRIEAKLEHIEAKTDNVLTLMVERIGPPPSTTAILENGEHTGILITNEKFPQEMIDDVNLASDPNKQG
jgi:hypothetical protein